MRTAPRSSACGSPTTARRGEPIHGSGSPASADMKLLFFARHYSYLRLFESAISDLASRGHQIHLSADREESMGGRRLAERLAETYPGVTLGATPGRAPDAWSEFSRRLRLGIDYLRYLEPRY